MYSFSVIGSCPCRDFLEFHKDRYNVETDVRFQSIFSIVANPLSGAFFDESIFKKNLSKDDTNWFRKNLLIDLNKNLFNKLNERHGEYLIIDFAETRSMLARIFHNNEELLVTWSSVFRRHFKSSMQIFNKDSFEIINPLTIPKESIYKCIESFLESIKKIFPTDKIILIENFPAHFYLDEFGSLKPYASPQHLYSIYESDLLLSDMYEYFQKICPSCKVIKRLSNALGNTNHVWGLHPYHYDITYYNYLNECLSEILLGNDNYDYIREKYYAIFEEMKKSAMIKEAEFYEKNANSHLNVNQFISSFDDLNILSGKKKKLLTLFLNRESKKYERKNKKNLLNRK